MRTLDRSQRRRTTRGRSSRPATTWAACAFAALVLSCGSGNDAAGERATTAASAIAADAARPRNLLLVSIDTLRHDHLGHAGHGRDTSPAIDRLARDSVVFERAYSQSGWTLPSMASLLTGRSPAAHGATHFNARIDASIPTLATILGAAGYATRGFVSHILLRPQYGFGAGFETFDTSVLALGRPKDVMSAAPLTDLALAALDSAPEPFFVWVHYFDPHNDYLAHPRFAAFGDDDIGRYDQEIAATDFEIGRLLDALDATGRATRTVVVLTADHGEEFGEHGGEYHYTLHEEVVRIPLLIRVPGMAPRVDPTPVQQIDVVPSVLGALGVPVDATLPGRDLLASEVARTPVFIERIRPSGFHQRAMIDGTRKLVVIELVEPEPGDPPTPTPVDHIEAGVYYYDLAKDPDELSPLDPAAEPDAARMLEAMARHFASIPAGAVEAVELSPETEAALRALGYLK